MPGLENRAWKNRIWKTGLGKTGHRKTGPLRVRSKFVGAGADYHLPEGNSCRPIGRDLGGWTTNRRQQQFEYA